MYNPEAKYPIIEVQNSKKGVRYWLERIIAVIATALVWFFFSRYIAQELLAASEKTVGMTLNLLFIIALAVGILVYWQAFNILMYRKKERRKEFPAQSSEYVAALYGVKPKELDRMRTARLVTMQFEGGKYYLLADTKAKPIRLKMQL